MKNRRKLINSGLCAAIVTVALLVVSGCAAKNARAACSAPTPAAPADSALLALEKALDEADRYGLALDHFVAARDYERRGVQNMAEQLYETAFDFWPKSSFLRKALTERYMRRDEYQKVLGLYFRAGETLADLNSDEKRSVILIYFRLGDVAKAAEVINSLGGEMSEEEMYSLALLYKSAGKSEMVFGAFREFLGGAGRGPGMGMKLAQMYISERGFAEAESLAVIMRGAFPGSAEAVSLLGTVKHLARDTASAIRLFNEALALDSLNEEALRTLAHIHIIRDQYPEAVKYYKRLTAQPGLGAPYRRGLALLLFHLKEHEEAGKLLDALLEENDTGELPGVYELHVYRGLIHQQNKEYGKAASLFNAAIAINPQNEDAWRELCYAWLLAKDRENAWEAVELYNAAFPNSGEARRFRGYVLNMMEKYEEAIAALREAVRFDTSDYFSWYKLGSVLERRKRIDEAADAFRAALRLRPGEAEVSNYLGYMWAEAGINLDSAKVLIENALKAEPKNGAYLDSYAWVFYMKGDYEKALHYMNEALENVKDDPSLRDDPVLYEHLGDIKFKLGDYRAAEAAYTRCLELKSEEAGRIRARLAEIKKLMRSGRKGN